VRPRISGSLTASGARGVAANKGRDPRVQGGGVAGRVGPTSLGHWVTP